jgi:hypothetical protein
MDQNAAEVLVTTSYRRNPAVEAAPMQDETILFDPATNKFCLLNGTAAWLWSRLEEPCTVEQLSSGLLENFHGVTPMDADRDVRSAIEHFRDLSFVVPEA